MMVGVARGDGSILEADLRGWWGWWRFGEAWRAVSRASRRGLLEREGFGEAETETESVAQVWSAPAIQGRLGAFSGGIQDSLSGVGSDTGWSWESVGLASQSCLRLRLGRSSMGERNESEKERAVTVYNIRKGTHGKDATQEWTQDKACGHRPCLHSPATRSTTLQPRLSQSTDMTVVPPSKSTHFPRKHHISICRLSLPSLFLSHVSQLISFQHMLSTRTIIASCLSSFISVLISLLSHPRHRHFPPLSLLSSS